MKMKRGRRTIVEDNMLINEILSLWDEKGDVLRFMDIHRKFVKVDVVSNIKYKSSTMRILNRLIQKGYLERIDRGKYQIKVSPKPFQVSNIINQLREKYGDKMIYEWRTGGFLWTLAEGVIYGFPRDIEDSPLFNEILRVLLIRLSSIFKAIVMLGVSAKLFKDIKKAPIPYTAVREYIVSIIPYILGERSGIDFDGLPGRDLIELYKKIIKSMPNEIDGQPIDIDGLKGYTELGEKLLNFSMSLDEYIDTKLMENKLDWDTVRELKNVVLVIYPSRDVIDKDQEERELYELLKSYIDKGISDASILSSIILYDENIVHKVIRYLEPILKGERAKRLIKLYKLAMAGRVLDNVISIYLVHKGREEGSINLKYMEEVIDVEDEEYSPISLKEYLDKERRRGYTLRDMIMGVWLSRWPSITPKSIRYYIMYFKEDEKEEIVNVAEELIKEVLTALDIRFPRNIDTILEKGYRLALKLEESLEKDQRILLKNIKEKLGNNP